MKKITLFLLIIITVSLVACANDIPKGIDRIQVEGATSLWKID